MGWFGGADHAEWLKMMLIVLGGGETGPTVPQTISHIQRYYRAPKRRKPGWCHTPPFLDLVAGNLPWLLGGVLIRLKVNLVR